MNIEASIFKNKLENKIIISNSDFNNVPFEYSIEKIGSISILRYKIDTLEDVYEVDYPVIKELNLTLEEYFESVLKLILFQIIKYKENKFKIDDQEFSIHEDDIKFLEHFEKIHNDTKTGKRL